MYRCSSPSLIKLSPNNRSRITSSPVDDDTGRTSVVASTIISSFGDIHWFPTPEKLSSYFGLGLSPISAPETSRLHRLPSRRCVPVIWQERRRAHAVLHWPHRLLSRGPSRSRPPGAPAHQWSP
ncbi:MAG: IS110 family transposase [Mesorhizobium sp.]|nr:MAG: IS110 family transposase [Mesorhizobium sp.]